MRKVLKRAPIERPVSRLTVVRFSKSDLRWPDPITLNTTMFASNTLLDIIDAVMMTIHGHDQHENHRHG
jgi:hypothetical protein